MSSDFHSSMACATKHTLECVAIKEARLRQHKVNLLATLYGGFKTLAFSHWLFYKGY